jgi:predicted kinase
VHPLVLTGGPAVGKTVTGRMIAEDRPRAAFIDVDDIRQMVVSGADAPWRAPEGTAQAALAADITAAMARRFAARGFEVVIADVLTPETTEVYRRELPDCRIVHLVIDVAEARRRASRRTVWLTDAEFEFLHRRDRERPPGADARIDVTSLDVTQQVAAVARLWLPRP